MNGMDRESKVRLEMAKVQLADNLEHEVFGKQMLAIRIANEILESENFLEAYPVNPEPEWMKKVLTRVLWKNGVSTEAGRAIFSELAERYEERINPQKELRKTCPAGDITG